MNLQSSQQLGCFDVCNVHQRAISQSQIPLYAGRAFHPIQDGLTTEDHQTTKRQVDEMLAQAMTGLTFEERQQHQEILHGVDERIAEEASVINNKLEELDLHLLFMKEGTTYELAEQMNASYVNNRAFRIMFLRANEYDPIAAADQMIRFFDLKCELFGKAKLTKDITIEDLDQDDIAALESGWIQAAGRDQSGRQVLVLLGDVPIADLPKNIMSVIRSQYFVFMTALRSEETQLRGIVTIWYGLGKYKRPGNSKEYRALMNYGIAIPRKKAAIHALMDDIYQYTFLEFSMKVTKPNFKARFRVHFGSHLECQYQLTTFGISSSTLPIDAQGRVEVARHIDWIRSCAIEDNVTYCSSAMSSSALHPVSKPSPNDVLFQSGKTINHEGNRRLRAVVADYIQAYANSGNDEVKRELVATVIGKIHANGGRFLKRAGNSTTTWEEVPPDELRKKIMQTFRNHRRLASGSKPSGIGSIDGVLIAGDPLPNDVIFGRLVQKNAGTEMLYGLIKENFEEYESLNRGEKMKLVEFMMQTIRDRGGRFLQSNTETNGWIEVPHDDARERISKYFRNHRRQSSKKS